jgi:molybdopterin-guanine dinucleotide biosynthesis protein A
MSAPAGLAVEIGFVLAGGQSSRMGKDKALTLFEGRALVEIALATLHEAGVPASIAGARSDLSGFGSVVEDPSPDQGPLAGICAALAATSAERTVFLSVDLPLLPASLIGCLLGQARITGRAVTVASVNGFAQTFPAVLDKALLPFLERSLHSGQRGSYAAFQEAARAMGQPVSILPTEVLAQTGQAAHPSALPPVWWFLNVNSPVDLARAESILRALKSETVENAPGSIA